jgi:Acyltransferase
MGRAAAALHCSLLLLVLLPVSNAFLLPRALHRRPTRQSVAVSKPPEDVVMTQSSSPSSSTPSSSSSPSFVLSKEESRPILRIGKDDKEKVVNAFGLYCLLVSLVTGPLWMAAMALVQATVGEERDPHRSLFDTTGKIWAKTWLTLTYSYPTLAGSATPLPVGSPCLYVANHASWLDIPVICTVLDPVVFKFIAKGELRKAPCIGQQLAGVRIIIHSVSLLPHLLRTHGLILLFF